MCVQAILFIWLIKCKQDLEEELDDLIADLKMQMEAACAADNEALDNGQPAVHKVKLLPQVMALLNRQNIQHAILDPETNFLQAVKFFLEPLNADGSLPAYNIQREIFTALTRLPVEKEALLSSGIGKVVLFYTKTKRAQPEIKRMAERLMGEWSRPILKRTDDYKKRFIATKNVDLRYVFSPFPNRKSIIFCVLQFHSKLTHARTHKPSVLKSSSSQRGLPSASQASSLAHRPSASQAGGAVSSVSQKLAERRAKALAPVVANPNRARPVGLPQSYTVAPVSNTAGGGGAQGPDHRPVGASGMEAFRRMTQKGKKKN